MYIVNKVINYTGETWFQVNFDGSNNGYVPFSAVKVFDNVLNCDENPNDAEGHIWTYPDYDVLVECSKCGYHVSYDEKPSKDIGNNHKNVFTSKDQLIHSTTGNSDNVISLNAFIDVLRDLEEKYREYYVANHATFDEHQFGQDMIKMFFGFGRHNGYDTGKWQIMFLFDSDFDSDFYNELLRLPIPKMGFAP